MSIKLLTTVLQMEGAWNEIDIIRFFFRLFVCYVKTLCNYFHKNGFNQNVSLLLSSYENRLKTRPQTSFVKHSWPCIPFILLAGNKQAESIFLVLLSYMREDFKTNFKQQ